MSRIPNITKKLNERYFCSSGKSKVIKDLFNISTFSTFFLSDDLWPMLDCHRLSNVKKI